MAGGSLETFKWAYTKASRMDFPNDDLVKSMPGMLLRQQQKVIPLILHWLRFSDVLTMYMLIVTCLNLLLVMMVLPSLHVDIVGDSSLLYLLAGVYLRKLSLNL